MILSLVCIAQCLLWYAIIDVHDYDILMSTIYTKLYDYGELNGQDMHVAYSLGNKVLYIICNYQSLNFRLGWDFLASKDICMYIATIIYSKV